VRGNAGGNLLFGKKRFPPDPLPEKTIIEYTLSFDAIPVVGIAQREGFNPDYPEQFR